MLSFTLPRFLFQFPEVPRSELSARQLLSVAGLCHPVVRSVICAQILKLLGAETPFLRSWIKKAGEWLPLPSCARCNQYQNYEIDFLFSSQSQNKSHLQLHRRLPRLIFATPTSNVYLSSPCKRGPKYTLLCTKLSSLERNFKITRGCK